MNNPKRVRRVTVKTERTYVFRVQSDVHFAWCAECEAETGMQTVSGAAKELGMTELEIYRLIEARAVHFSEDASGHVVICLRSFK